MSSNFNSLFKSNSGIADGLNQHYQKGQQSIIRKPDQGTRRASGASKSSFSYQEQQTLHDLGSRMRGANANQHALYQRQLEQLIGDREITGADARLEPERSKLHITSWFQKELATTQKALSACFTLNRVFKEWWIYFTRWRL
jgi:hypothetical protein